MKENENRRKFLLNSVQSAAGLMILPLAAQASNPNPSVEVPLETPAKPVATRIKFSVIGMNHGHIYGQVGAVQRGGGELVSYYAKEANLMADFKKRFPQAKAAASEI